MRKKPSPMAHQISLEKPNTPKTLPLGISQLKSSSSSSSISPKRHQNDGVITAILDGQDSSSAAAVDHAVVVDQVIIRPSNVVSSDEALLAAEAAAAEEGVVAEESGREEVWIPEIWGQEELLQDWIDCSAFDNSLFPGGIMSARSALVEEAGRRENSGRSRIENRC